MKRPEKVLKVDGLVRQRGFVATDPAGQLSIVPFTTSTDVVLGDGSTGTVSGGVLTAHAPTHEAGGSDPIQLDDLAAPSDNTDLNASTTAHGLLLKATAPASGLLSAVGIGNGETAYTNKPLFDTTNPAALGTAAPGTQLLAARRDHVHTLPKLDDLAAPDDNTDLNVSITAHGLAPKAPNDATKYLDGTGAYSVPAGTGGGGGGGPASITVLTVGTGTYNVPADRTRLLVIAVGSGGGGGGADTQGVGAGGGGGGIVTKIYDVAPSDPFDYIVTAGGAGGLAGNNEGTDGGDTVFDDGGAGEITAGGGDGGNSQAGGTGVGSVGGGTGGSATGGDINIIGPLAQRAYRFGGTEFVSSNGANHTYGPGGDSGTSGGSAGSAPTSGSFGAGGGGATSPTGDIDRAGGNGAPGVIFIYEYE